jgi:hypothetical protein
MLMVTDDEPGFVVGLVGLEGFSLPPPQAGDATIAARAIQRPNVRSDMACSSWRIPAHRKNRTIADVRAERR